MASQGAKFCTACGVPLPAGARFCGACGAPVAAAAPIEADKTPAAAAAAGERRQVTILFADLSGFTTLAREIDAEELHGLMVRVFDVVDGIVENYGGSVDKHIGDAVMALFGTPVAHGDDPLRALRGAFDIHQAMAGLSEELGRTLQVHIGIASGEVVAAGVGRDDRREYTVVGESVNLASRLDELAKPGETLISDAVWRSVSGQVEGESLGEVTVKGLDESVRVWRVRALKSAAAEVARSTFVGRRSELAQFAGVVAACREAGSGQAILVRGEAGIGKTRLVEEFTAIAEGEGFASHKGLVFDFGVGKGQDAVRALVRSLLDIPRGSGKSARRATADAAIAGGVLQADQRAFLNDLLDLPQPVEMRALYDAMDNPMRNAGKQAVVTALIESVSSHQPILVTVEDIHWAGALTLAHLVAMTAAVRERPALLVMTTRIEGDPLDKAWRAATRGAPLMTIDLGPLRDAEAIELAGGFIDATNRYAQNCIARAEGNPLFLEQLLRNAEESEDESVPASIQSLVLARMDRLAASDKQALQAAAVIGQRFALEALRHLIDDAGYDCAELMEHYLVRPEGDSYLFAHALIREGVYSSLLKARARELNRAAAQWFAERDPVLYAQHLDRAEDAAAPQAYLAAARGQAAAYHFERALGFVERGLHLARDTVDEYALTAFHGELLHNMGSVPESIAAYRQALDLAADDRDRCQAWIGLAAGMRVTDQYDEALEMLDKAEAAATEDGLTLQLARVHHLRGNIYFPLGNVEGCREEHEKALEFARRADSPEAEARALSGLGDAHYTAGRMITAHDYFRRCVEICRERGFGRIEVANRSMVGFSRHYLNELEEALDDGVAAAEAAAKVGHHRAELLGRIMAYFALIDMGEMERAREPLAQAQALTRRLGARRFESQNLLCLGIVARSAGDSARALELVKQAMEISRDTGTSFSGPRILGFLGLTADDPAERRQALEEGERLLGAGAVGHNHFWFYRFAMEACLEAGEWDEVERYAAALEDYTRPEPLPWSDFFIARGRALAAFGRGERDVETMQRITRLADEARRIGFKTALPALERALAGTQPEASGRVREHAEFPEITSQTGRRP